MGVDGGTQHTRRNQWSFLLDAVVSVALLSAAGVVVWKATGQPVLRERAAPEAPAAAQSLAGAHTKGSASADVVLIEYSDFRCRFCGEFARTVLPGLEKSFIDTGQLLLAFRHSPPGENRRAAFASECAAEQGQFWPLHDALFEVGRTLDNQGIEDAAKQVTMDIATWNGCMERGSAAKISADLESARQVGVTGTPYFLLGIREGEKVWIKSVLVGAKSFEAFKESIESLLRLRVG